MPQLRKDAISSNWVIVSSERGLRPNDYRNKKQACPFCPGNEEQTPPEIFSIKKGGSWKIRVVSNKYPALVNPLKHHFQNQASRRAPAPASGRFVFNGADRQLAEGNPIYKNVFGFGLHEVVIETPDHEARMERLSEKDLAQILDVYAMRHAALIREKGIKYVMVFKNYGPNAGASLKHPHSQIIAMPVVPTRLKSELENSSKYFARNGSCPYCDMIKNERRERARIVEENAEFIAFAPFASRFCFETWIFPKKHSSRFESVSGDTGRLASILKKTLSKLAFSIDGLSYNLIVQSSPCGRKCEKHFHWRLEILPKLAMMAGFEWGSGFYMNSVSPEQAAKILNSGEKYRY